MPKAKTPPIKDIVITSKDPELILILKDIKQTLDIREGRLGDTGFRFVDYYEFSDLLVEVLDQGLSSLTLNEQVADPVDPIEGQSIIWQSDGTGSGADGDIMIKITAGGVTKTGTLVDFSAL